MKFTDIFITASSSLLRSKLRTFLTVIAIFIGAITITLTNGIGTGVENYVGQQLDNLGASNVLVVELNTNDNNSKSTTPPKYKYDPNRSVSGSGLGQEQLMMNSKDLSIIKSVPNIIRVLPAESPAPDYIQGKGDKYQLSLAQQIGDSSPAMIAGKGLNVNDPKNEISIPESYVHPLGFNNDEDILGKTVTIGITTAQGIQETVTATVVGIQEKSIIGPSTTYANLALANELNFIQNIGIPKNLANTFQTAYATFPNNLTDTQVNIIKKELKDKGFTAQTIKDEESTTFSIINVIIIIFDLFGAIALLAASFGIINTLLMSVQERTKEIGLMKALGMGSRNIFILFSIEAILLGFWGSILGSCFAVLLGRIINHIGSNSFLKNFPGLSLLTFPIKTIIVVVVCIMLISFLAGTLPALRASRKNPIEALRYE